MAAMMSAVPLHRSGIAECSRRSLFIGIDVHRMGAAGSADSLTNAANALSLKPGLLYVEVFDGGRTLSVPGSFAADTTR